MLQKAKEQGAVNIGLGLLAVGVILFNVAKNSIDINAITPLQVMQAFATGIVVIILLGWIKSIVLGMIFHWKGLKTPSPTGTKDPENVRSPLKNENENADLPTENAANGGEGFSIEDEKAMIRRLYHGSNGAVSMGLLAATFGRSKSYIHKVIHEEDQ